MTEARLLHVVFVQTLITIISISENCCLKALDILEVVGHTDWGGVGADRKTLLCLYRSLVRSTLDYGCIVYGAASTRILQKLDPIHHQGLQIAPGT